jgi:hypothetical protein
MRKAYDRGAYLAAVMARDCSAPPNVVAGVVMRMQRAAKAAKNWELRHCNEPITEKQEAVGQKRIDRLESRIRQEIEELGFSGATGFLLGGDCRGACGVLQISRCSTRGDNWQDSEPKLEGLYKSSFAVY